MRTLCSQRGVGAPSCRPPPAARPQRPTLPALSIAAAALHLPQEISRAYGPDACKLLPINSRTAGAPPLPDLWTGARPPEFDPSSDAPPPPTEELGALLSDADMEQARTPAPDPRPRPSTLDPDPDAGPYPGLRTRTRTRALPPTPDPAPAPTPDQRGAGAQVGGGSAR